MIVVKLPDAQALAIVEAVSTSGKETYTPEGTTLFEGVQRIERELERRGKIRARRAPGEPVVYPPDGPEKQRRRHTPEATS